MYFDRIRAKQGAKAIIRTVKPSPIFITLIFLLLTSVLQEVVALFVSNPFLDVVSYLQEGYNPMVVYSYVFGRSESILGIFVTVLFMLYNAIMTHGYAAYSLRLTRHGRGGVGDLIHGFNMATKIVVMDLLITVFTVLWSMLFFIPGIIAAYSYSQASYCLIENPEIGPLEAIRRSKKLMRGQKFNLFVLQLSFIGWQILGTALSNGILFGLGVVNSGLAFWVSTGAVWLLNLWVMPYFNLTYAAFYNNLVGYGREPEPETPPRVEF